jgi:aminoglycoside phosphotransferase family enzyme
VEVVLKSRHLRGREWEYLVKWKGYHPIEASRVNESDMKHAQKAIEKFHNRPTKKQKKHRMWWRHHLSSSGVGNYTNVPHQVASEIKVKDFQEIASWT